MIANDFIFIVFHPFLQKFGGYILTWDIPS